MPRSPSVRDRVREPMAGEIRLQWWRDVLNGERAGEAAANPVAAALTRHRSRASRCRPQPLLDLIEAHAFDLYDDPMPTLVALEAYARKTVGGRVRAGGADLRRRDAPPRGGGRAAGIACAITELLRRFARARVAAPALRSGRDAGTSRRARRGRDGGAGERRAARARSRRCAARRAASRGVRAVAAATAGSRDAGVAAGRAGARLSRWRWSGTTTTRSRRRSRCRNGGVSGLCGARRGAMPARCAAGVQFDRQRARLAAPSAILRPPMCSRPMRRPPPQYGIDEGCQASRTAISVGRKAALAGPQPRAHTCRANAGCLPLPVLPAPHNGATLAPLPEPIGRKIQREVTHEAS